jgi:hypothetical protein
MSTTKAKAAAAENGRVSPTAPKSKSVSAGVWEALESQPGFSDSIRTGEAQIAKGESVRLSEVRRRR